MYVGVTLMVPELRVDSDEHRVSLGVYRDPRIPWLEGGEEFLALVDDVV